MLSCSVLSSNLGTFYFPNTIFLSEEHWSLEKCIKCNQNIANTTTQDMSTWNAHLSPSQRCKTDISPTPGFLGMVSIFYGHTSPHKCIHVVLWYFHVTENNLLVISFLSFGMNTFKCRNLWSKCMADNAVPLKRWYFLREVKLGSMFKWEVHSDRVTETEDTMVLKTTAGC